MVYLPLAVLDARAIEPVDVPGMPSTGAIVYEGAADEVVLLPNSVPPAAFASAAVSVPDEVTAALGVLLRTVPSPVKVTLVTVPVPVGRSEAAIARNVGVAFDPDTGPPRKVFFTWEMSDRVTALVDAALL
jgi:hypothetical protein